MRVFFRSLLGVAVLFGLTSRLPAQEKSSPREQKVWPGLSQPGLADYDSELRLPNGRVDIDGTLRRVKQLHVGTYYFLIDHAATDWDDLKLFLPKAAKAGLEVWVYILPPRESPPSPFGATFSEPFRLNYPRWAEEIARLSLKHPNLTGWMIDDFYLDHKTFTPDYVRAFQAKAKAINPRLAFLPLMYPPEITRDTVEQYRHVVDGIVVAYLQDRSDIDRVWELLNDAAPLPQSDEIIYPWYTVSQQGDFCQVSQTAKVEEANRYVVRFHERDSYTGSTAGYHIRQLLVDGQVEWEQDMAGGSGLWDAVTVNVTRAVHGKKQVTLAFRLFDKQPVGNFGASWRITDLRTSGLDLDAPLSDSTKWKVTRQGAFETGFGTPTRTTSRQFHVPFISMTAAQEVEFQLRHGGPPTPKRIADMLRTSLEAWRAGKCDGVVSYCLDLGPKSKTYPAVQKVFEEFSALGK